MGDIVFTNGRVWNGRRCEPGSLRISGDRIQAPADALADALAGAGAGAGAERVIDLDGAAILPGFADGHAHPVFGGTEPVLAPVRGATSVEELVGAVGAWAAQNPDAGWVQGWGYNPALTPDGRFAARWLDAVVSDRPVVLRAEDYHTVWCNSEALRLAGIDEATPDPRNGRIARAPDGQPLGTLLEWGAVRMVLDLVDRPSPAERRAALVRGLQMLADAGVTWVQDAWVEPDDVELYLAAARDGALPIRVNLGLRVEPGAWQAQRDGFQQARDAVQSLGDPLLTCQTVKFFIDGCIELGTAHVLEPYLDAPDDVGLAMWDTADMTEAATAFDSDGFQLHIHAIGDAGVRRTLDVIESVAQANGARDRRPVLAHAQLVDPADLPRFAELGVIANFQPAWAQQGAVQTTLIAPRLGRERADRQYPVRTLVESGAPVTFGSDWPCGPHPPLGGLRTIITRTVKGGTEPWVPQQRIGVTEAVRAHTAAVAHQAYAEREWGSLRAGRYADLVVLSDDPSAIDPERLDQLEVLSTWVAGRQVH